MARLRAVASLTLALMPILFIAYWYAPGAFGSLAPDLPPGMAWDGLTAPKQWIVRGLAALPFVAAMYAVLRVRTLFDRYAAGDMYSREAISHVAGLGRAWLAWVLLRLALEPVQSLLLTWDLGPGARLVTVSVDGDALIAALLGTLLMVIATALQMGRRAVMENNRFV